MTTMLGEIGQQKQERSRRGVMLAAVLEDVGRMPLREVPRPKPARGEVLVRVKAVGVCGTDYAAYTGKRKDWEPGSILGHEPAGVIEDLGEGAAESVNQWRAGDEVIINPVVHCGQCRNCRLSLEHYCLYGQVIGGEGQPTKRPGAFAEFVAVPVQSLYRKPPGLSWECAAETEPLAGSWKGMIEYSRLRPPEDVVIIGTGTMGLLLLQVALAGGAGRVVIADVSGGRLGKATELGATHVVNSGEEDLKDRVGQILPWGPDIVFDAAGVLPTAKQAFELTRRGTRVNMFGVITPGEIPVSPADLHWKETRMDASFSVMPRAFTRAIDLMERGRADPSKIVTHHRFSLDEMPQALEAMDAPHRIKVMIFP